MSDENNGTVATQVPPTAAAAEEGASRTSSKAMLVVGGVAVVVLAVFAYVLFGTGGGDSAEDLGPVPKAQAPAKAPASDTKSTDKAKSDSKSSSKSEDVEGRNPFEPLVTETTTTETETGTTTGTGTTAPTGETVTVSLTKVSDSGVTAAVDGKTYKNVAEGETFATNYQVYAIFNASCAGFLYGDNSFVLCEGKSIDLAKL